MRPYWKFEEGESEPAKIDENIVAHKTVFSARTCSTELRDLWQSIAIVVTGNFSGRRTWSCDLTTLSTHHHRDDTWWVFLLTLFHCDDTSLSSERISLLWHCDGCPLSGTLVRGTDWVHSSRTESWTSSQIFFPHGFVLLTSCLTLGHTQTCHPLKSIS